MSCLPLGHRLSPGSRPGSCAALAEQEGYFVSESSAFRLLKRIYLAESPAFHLVTVVDRFAHHTRQVNEVWQRRFTNFNPQGWGCHHLSTALDDYSRHILAWRLTATMGGPGRP